MIILPWRGNGFGNNILFSTVIVERTIIPNHKMNINIRQNQDQQIHLKSKFAFILHTKGDRDYICELKNCRYIIV